MLVDVRFHELSGFRVQSCRRDFDVTRVWVEYGCEKMEVGGAVAGSRFEELDLNPSEFAFCKFTSTCRHTQSFKLLLFALSGGVS